jgi:hypothetical protein
LTHLCIHSKSSDGALRITQNGIRSSLKSIVHMPAYVDLYNITLKTKITNKINTPVYHIQLSGSLLSPISFEKKIQIDNRSFPTVDNIEEHLLEFYGQNYTHDELS